MFQNLAFVKVRLKKRSWNLLIAYHDFLFSMHGRPAMNISRFNATMLVRTSDQKGVWRLARD